MPQGNYAKRLLELPFRDDVIDILLSRGAEL